MKDAPKCRSCQGRDDLKPVHPRVRWGAAQKRRGGNGFAVYSVLMCSTCRRRKRGQWQHARFQQG